MRSVPALLIALSLFGLFTGCSRDHPERIFVNATVISLDENNTVAEALAVTDGRISALGSRESIMQLAGPDTEVVDLTGKTLLPGFIAAHEHPAISAVFRNFIDLSGFTHNSPAQAWQALDAAIAETPKGDWVYAMGLDPVLLQGLQLPDREFLDRIAPEHPVFILAQSMHTAWVNSAALAAMGIDEQSADPGTGSYYGRDDSGRLNGMLVEKAAMEPFLARHKQPLRVASAYAEVLRDLRAAGYTSIASLGFNVPAWLAQWAALDGLTPHIRQFFYYRGDNLQKLEGEPQPGSLSLHIKGGKFWFDGSPYSGSMLLEQPYTDSALSEQLGISHGGHGEAVISAEQLGSMIQQLDARGWQTATHIQGDRAAREFLALIQQQLGAMSEGQRQAFVARRHRLEHGLLLSRELLPEFARLGMSPSFHINHLYYYGEALRGGLLGSDRSERLLPVRSAFTQGMRPTLHADSPMFPAQPFSLMQTAVTRRSRAGTVFNASEALTPEQALRTMTINAAWQLGMEEELGSLEVGKLADLVIVDRNPLTTPPVEWRDIRVLDTVVADRPAVAAASYDG